MAPAAAFQERLRRDLLVARRDRDEAATRAIKLLLSAVANGEAVPAGETDLLGRAIGPSEAPRRELDDEAIRALVTSEIGTHRDAAAEYRSLGADTSAIEAELAVMERYLRP